MRGTGYILSKELVGRCLAVYPGNEKLTFSGFCIRWRKNSDKVMTDFLLQVLKTENVRILMRGRGANIQNLNQQILGKLMIPGKRSIGGTLVDLLIFLDN